MFACFKDKVFLKRFIAISLPVMVSAIITFLVSFIDNIMVGTVSNEAVSGVYAANEVTYLYNLAAFGLLEGAGIFIQQFNGAKDKLKTKECFCFKLLSSILFLLVAIPVVYLFGEKLIWEFSKSDTNVSLIMEEGRKYLMVVAISYVPFLFGSVYSSSLREIGKTKYAMYASIVAVIANVFFNFLFITVFKQGVVGAAIATIIARTFEMGFLIFICSYKKFSFCDRSLKDFHISKALAKKILNKGTILFVNEIGFSVGVVLQALAFAQRDGVLSSISIVSTISNIFGILITGLSTGIGVMVGSDLGSGDFKKAKDDNFKLNLLGFYAAIVGGLLLIALSYPIPYLFAEVDLEQKQLATKLIIVYGSLLWGSVLAVTSYFTLRVGGKSFLTFILDTGMMIVLYVPLSWILAALTNLDMLYIYLIIRLLDVVKAFFGMFLIRRGTWVNNLTFVEDK